MPPGVALEQPHAQQAQLISFFVNPLLTTASGAVTPAEAIPHWLQPLVFIDPIRHFSVIARSNLIKGTGFAALWVDFLMLWSKRLEQHKQEKHRRGPSTPRHQELGHAINL